MQLDAVGIPINPDKQNRDFADSATSGLHFVQGREVPEKNQSKAFLKNSCTYMQPEGYSVQLICSPRVASWPIQEKPGLVSGSWEELKVEG